MQSSILQNSNKKAIFDDTKSSYSSRKMSNILNVKYPGDYSGFLGQSDPHPLVSVIEFDRLSPVRHSLNNYDVYGMFMHEHLSVGDLTYGCGRYDYTDGTLICVAPGQTGGKEDNGELVDLDGWALLFHPDILHGTHLQKEIKNYTFFDYHINEALHMTAEERDVFISMMRHIKNELESGRDRFQDNIIVGYISLLLNYCMRFYQRQFVTRTLDNSNILVRFNSLLNEYYDSGLQLKHGLPGVQYFADRLCMSPNYFSDLVKKTTGDTSGSHIRRFIIQKIKNGLASGMSVSQVAYNTSFDYPQHLSRMFRNIEGITPTEYIARIKNGSIHNV